LPQKFEASNTTQDEPKSQKDCLGARLASNSSTGLEAGLLAPSHQANNWSGRKSAPRHREGSHFEIQRRFCPMSVYAGELGPEPLTLGLFRRFSRITEPGTVLAKHIPQTMPTAMPPATSRG